MGVLGSCLKYFNCMIGGDYDDAYVPPEKSRYEKWAEDQSSYQRYADSLGVKAHDVMIDKPPGL